jgi:hypothetical protein
MLLYGLGARHAAVIELSVGAGLVFILFVFTISLAGEAASGSASATPRYLAATMAGLGLLLLGELAWPNFKDTTPAQAVSLSTSLWADRQLDVLGQIVLIFTGALTVMGLLTNLTTAPSRQQPSAREDGVPPLGPAHGTGPSMIDGKGHANGQRRGGRPERAREEVVP